MALRAYTEAGVLGLRLRTVKKRLCTEGWGREGQVKGHQEGTTTEEWCRLEEATGHEERIMQRVKQGGRRFQNSGWYRAAQEEEDITSVQPRGHDEMGDPTYLQADDSLPVC
jgi:hypothetical protein